MAAKRLRRSAVIDLTNDDSSDDDYAPPVLTAAEKSSSVGSDTAKTRSKGTKTTRARRGGDTTSAPSQPKLAFAPLFSRSASTSKSSTSSSGSALGGVATQTHHRQALAGAQVTRSDSWSSFDDFQRTAAEEIAMASPGRDETKDIAVVKGVTKTEMWTDMYCPPSLSAVAIHRTKKDQVSQWLDHAFKGRKKLLLLSGPSGCGKSTLARAVVANAGASLCEWLPCSSVSWAQHSEEITYESELKQFCKFLRDAQLFQGLDFSSDGSGGGGAGGAGGETQRKVILVEDFPHLRDGNAISAFQKAVLDFTSRSRFPAIFVCTTRNKVGAAKLLQLDTVLNRSPDAEFVFLNPIAPTSIAKVLKGIVAEESVECSASAIDGIVTSCDGDLRNGINALQMTCTGAAVEDKKRKRGAGATKKKKGQTGLSRGDSVQAGAEGDDGGYARDVGLVIFHALGKVLMAKRTLMDGTPIEHDGTTSNVPPAGTLPSPLALPTALAAQSLERWPLKEQRPEQVVERSRMDGLAFNAFLHQNYLPFYTDTDDVARAASYLSDADVLGSRWQEKDIFGNYSASVAARGLLFSNARPCKPGWKPLHKPQLYEAGRKMTDNQGVIASVASGLVSRGVVPDRDMISASLRTELVPYWARMSRSGGLPGAAPHQRYALNRLTTWTAAGGWSALGSALEEGEDFAEDIDLQRLRLEGLAPQAQPGGGGGATRNGVGAGGTDVGGREGEGAVMAAMEEDICDFDD